MQRLASSAIWRSVGGIQLALALLLVAAAASIFVMLDNQSRSGGDVRDEASALVLLTDLQSTLADIDSAAASLVTIAMAGRVDESAHPSLYDHDIAGPLGMFDEKLAELRGVAQSPDQFDEIASTRDRLASALATLHDGAFGQDLMSIYHDSIQSARAELDAAVRDMLIHDGEQLAEAIEHSASADRWLRTLLPLIMGLAAVVAVSMVRRQRQVRSEQLSSLTRQNQMKDEFIASVSHELRTPLTSIVGFLDVLRDSEGDFSEQKSELIEIAAQEALDLSYLVEDLLVIARVGAGGLSVASVPVSLRGQTAQVLESVMDVGEVSLVGGDVVAIADPARVRQILRNLLINCRRYGGNQVVIEMAREGSDASLTVIDDGPGVAVGDRERIFEAYQRAHRSRGVTDSVGLGLAVSRHLARLMGGDLRYVARPHGAAFELVLPAAVEHGGARPGLESVVRRRTAGSDPSPAV